MEEDKKLIQNSETSPSVDNTQSTTPESDGDKSNKSEGLSSSANTSLSQQPEITKLQPETNVSSETLSNISQPETTPILKNIVEALLFAADSPLTMIKLSEITNRSAEDILSAIEELNQEYEASNRSFRIEKVAQGFQLYTLPQYSIWLRALYKVSHHRLSRAALETLSIIVYNQPITRPEIEKIRGVDCTGPIVTLLERKLIRISGRAKKPGAPFLYGTSKEFLRYFGLQSLDDLPRKEELEEFLQKRNGQ